jgi:hypothetical protein
MFLRSVWYPIKPTSLEWPFYLRFLPKFGISHFNYGSRWSASVLLDSVIITTSQIIIGHLLSSLLVFFKVLLLLEPEQSEYRVVIGRSRRQKRQLLGFPFLRPTEAACCGRRMRRFPPVSHDRAGYRSPRLASHFSEFTEWDTCFRSSGDGQLHFLYFSCSLLSHFVKKTETTD